MEGKTRKKLEALLWKHTSKDFRGTIDGVKNVLVLRGGLGTCLVNLTDLTDAELLDKLPRKLILTVDVEAEKFRTIRRSTIENVVFYETVDYIKNKKFGPFFTIEEAKKAG